MLEIGAGRLAPDLLFFQKALYKVKLKESSAAWFHYVSIVLKLAYKKNKLYKTSDYIQR